MSRRFWLLAAALFAGSAPKAGAQEGPVTVSGLLANGAYVSASTVSQEWPVLFLTTPDKKLFICTLDYDAGAGFFDFRLPPPASVKSRCTEIR